MPTEVKTVIDRVTAYGRKPKTPTQVLRQARDLLAEEGKWCTGTMFEDGDAAEVFEDVASCGSWSACAVGAIGLVSGDFKVKVCKDWDEVEPHDAYDQWVDAVHSGETTAGLDEWFEQVKATGTLQPEYVDYTWNVDFFPEEGSLSWQACDLMGNTIQQEHEEEFGGRVTARGVDIVIEFNDGFADRQALLAMFDKAINRGHRLAREGK